MKLLILKVLQKKLDLEKAMGKEYDISDYDLILKLQMKMGKFKGESE